MVEAKQKVNFSWKIIFVASLILFICSVTKHTLFQSSVDDLGIFDQAVYLISQGEKPISTFMGFHILADHAAWIWYPLAFFYKVYPTVYWLFAIQTFALSFGALPIWYLSCQAGLSRQISSALVIAYLLYPLVFNINLFDFHLDTIIPALILFAVWALRENKPYYFYLSLFFILGCKEVFSLTTAAMGLWLALFEKQRIHGLATFVISLSWFLIAIKIIIPFYSGGSVEGIERHVHRYRFLGNSLQEIFHHIIFHPEVFLVNIFTTENIFYLFIVILPLVGIISFKGVLPLFSTIPCLMINLLASELQQKNLVFQYSLPILPFLFLSVIETWKNGGGWFRTKRAIVLWSLIMFVILAKYEYFWSQYLVSIDNWWSINSAVSLVHTQGGVYTTAEIAPHLTHRKLIKFTNVALPEKTLNEFDYILLNLRYPGWLSNREFVHNLITQVTNNHKFQLAYQNDDIYLFKKQ